MSGFYLHDTRDTDRVEAGSVVKRAVGFGREGFVAEVTARVADGFVTTRGESLTADFALAKAKVAARTKLTARKRALGFTADGLRDTAGARADFDFGFAVAA